MDDFRKIIYGVLVGFVVIVIAWIGFVYVSACGFSLACTQAAPAGERTPIPTLIPATLPAPERGTAPAIFNKCQVAAVNLIGAWVSAGYPETATFTFTDTKGATCEATFKKDVQPLFLESNLWYPGSLACASCHNSDVANASANMDLSSYAGMLMGSRRTNPAAKGNDIFGGGVWEQSKLYEMLFVKRMMPLGRPPSVPAEGPLVFAGQPVQSTAPAAETPTAALAVTPTP